LETVGCACFEGKLFWLFSKRNGGPFRFLFRALKKKKQTHVFSLISLNFPKKISFRFDLSYIGFDFHFSIRFQKVFSNIFIFEEKIIFCCKEKKIASNNFLFLFQTGFLSFLKFLVLLSLFHFILLHFTSFRARFTSDFFYFASMLNKQQNPLYTRLNETIFALISFVLLRNQKPKTRPFYEGQYISY
jgi:hypothetical protein